MSMPKRPKKHHIEDVSINEFKRLLPREWVYREKDRDYGIDGEVEIFTDEGIATGRMFYIQLKATDSKDKKVHTRVQIDNDTINYFQSLELPTLIIRYVDEANCIYFKWAHTIDRYRQKKESKSFTFHMNNHNKWNEDQPNLISKYLNKYFFLKNKSKLLPLNIYFNFTFNAINNITSHRLKSFLRTLLNTKKDKFNIVQKIEDSEIIINITDDTLSVNLSEIGGAYLHSIDAKEYSYEDMSDDIFITIAIALMHINRTADIIEVFQLISSNPTTLQNPDIAILFIKEFSVLGKNKEVIQLWKNIPASLKDEFVNMQFQLIALHSKEVHESDDNIYEYFLLEQIDNFIDFEDKSPVGVAYYNYAQFLRTRNYVKAFHFYNQALKNNPHYYKEDYIFKEIGGLLFDLDKYNMSSKCYKFGFELKEDLRSLVLYADALMLKGNYLESQRIFKQYFKEEKNHIDNEWILKEAVLNYLITNMNINHQNRDYHQAMNTEVIKNGVNNEKEYIKIITNIDALNPLCWFNLSILYSSKNREPLKVLMGFIICALLNTRDIEAWLNALKSAINTQECKMVELIISVGYYNCGESFLNKLYDFIENDSLNIELTKSFLSLIEDITSKVNSRENIKDSIPTIRIFDGNKFKNITDKANSKLYNKSVRL